MNWDWELTRLILALLSGAIISHCGSLVQITTQNEMASPSTLGMDGLAVGIVLVLYIIQGLGVVHLTLEELGLGSVIVMGLLLRFFPSKWVPYQGGRGDDFRFILLIGLSVNLMVGALFAVMQFLAMAFDHEFPDQLWFGRISSEASHLWIGAVFIVFIMFALGLKRKRQWKALLLGPGWCHGLNIPIKQITKEAFWLAFVGNLWVITQFGVFSFLGLLFPILLRQLPRYKGDPWRELTEGALICGVIFALLDHVCFNLTFHGAEVPVGLPASLFGSMALVILLWKRFLGARRGFLAKAPKRV